MREFSIQTTDINKSPENINKKVQLMSYLKSGDNDTSEANLSSPAKFDK